MQPDRVLEELTDILNNRAPAQGARFVLNRRVTHDHRQRLTYDSIKVTLRISPGHTANIMTIRVLNFNETKPIEQWWEEHWKLNLELARDQSEALSTSGAYVPISRVLASYEASSEIATHHHFGQNLRHEATIRASLRHFWAVALAALDQGKDFAEMRRDKSKCAFCYPEIVGLDPGEFQADQATQR